jgi:hypothetical protein
MRIMERLGFKRAHGEETKNENVYNMYRVKPNAVFGTFQLRQQGSLQAGVGP